jgi:outer membrane biosynthesis protein TonB
MLKKIAFALHVFVVLALLFGHLEKPKTYSNRLSLRSVNLKPVTKSSQSSSLKNLKPNKPQQAKIAKTPPSKPKDLKQPAKISKPVKQDEKKAQPVKKALKKEASVPKALEKKSNLQALQETIAKIEEKLDKLDQPQKTETALQDLNLDSSFSPEDDQTLALFSSQGIIEYLFQLLELPEKGKVNVEIKLNNLGVIEEVKVLQSESDKNSLYLLQNLKNLQIPFSKKEKIPSSLNVVFSNLNA